MKSFDEIQRRWRRLFLLQLLDASAQHTASEHLLAEGLSSMGSNSSSAQVRTELQWLKEQGYVTVLNRPGMRGGFNS